MQFDCWALLQEGHEKAFLFMSGESVSAPSRNVIPLTPIRWDICAGVFLAFAVSPYETPMLPLIVLPAVTPLENLTAGSPTSIFG